MSAAQTRLLRLGLQGLQIDIECAQGRVVDLAIGSVLISGPLLAPLKGLGAYAVAERAQFEPTRKGGAA